MNKIISFISIALISILLIPQVTNGQIQLVNYDSILVFENTSQLKNPWAGGMNSPQFSEIDLNNDGIKDLVVFERDWYGMIKAFVNGGSPNQIDYIHNPNYEHLFPEMHNWALLYDYNCDGKEDIFTSVAAGIACYRNDTKGSSALQFTLVSNLLRTQTSEGSKNLYVSPPDIPALADIDGDGDMDILSFGVLGKSVSYHRNLSMENDDNCDNLEFELSTDCWGYFSESSLDNSITLNDSCIEEKASNYYGGRHAGSAILAIDMDNNGLKDLLLGDISYNNVVMLRNTGFTNEAIMTSADYGFPSNSLSVDLTVFPAAYNIDVNNDSKKDLLFSPTNPNNSNNHNNIWFYGNTGSQTENIFEYQTNSFLQDEMIDVGEGARPVFFDANADGLLDIIIGNYGYFIESANYDSRLYLLINNGSQQSPSFEISDTDFAEISSLGLNGVYPSFGDMDGDGDDDMIAGDEDGYIHLFINTAAIGEASNFILSAPNYMNIDVGEAAMPQIIDVNGDSKLDLIIGEKSGTINYYENIGSALEPEYGSLATNDFFGGIDVMKECCGGYSVPFLTSDSVGNKLLYVSSESGFLYQYNNIENNISGDFTLVDSLFLNGLRATISGDDINGDGNDEFVYGEYAGGLRILRKGKPMWIGIQDNQMSKVEINIYPNPAISEVFVNIDRKLNYQQGSIKIFNHLGQLVHEDIISGTDYNIKTDLSAQQSGVYIIQINIGNEYFTRKLIKY